MLGFVGVMLPLSSGTAAAMVRIVGVQRADNAEIVGAARQVRQQFR